MACCATWLPATVSDCVQEFCIRTDHFIILDCVVCTCSYWVVHTGENKALLGEAKAHKPVLAAMRAHAGVAAVQKSACLMLYNMANISGEWLCTRVLHSH